MNVSWRNPFLHILSLSHTCPMHQPSFLFSVSQTETRQRAKKIPRLLDTPKMSSRSNRGPSAWGENQRNNHLLWETSIFLPILYLRISLGHLSFLSLFFPTLVSSWYLLEFGFQGPCLTFATSAEKVPDTAPAPMSQFPGQGGHTFQVPGNAGADRALFLALFNWSVRPETGT